MLQFLFPAVIILLAIAVVAAVIIRHFPQAAAIDVDSLPAEQEAAMKAALMERRLKRKIMDFKNKLLPLWRKTKKGTVLFWKNFHGRVSQLEQRYRRKPDNMSASEQADVKQKIRLLLEQAHNMEQEEKWSDTEQKYIEILSWDPKNLEAYLGLGKIYISKKEFKSAKQTFVHLLKLLQVEKSGEDTGPSFSSPLTEVQITEAYFDYVVCLQVLEEIDEAVEEMKLVVGRDANNPKYLDKLVELAILQKDRSAAFEALKMLREVNPENQKINGFEEQIRGLPF